MIDFWKSYASEFDVRYNKIILKDLNLQFQMSDKFLLVFKNYFRERENYNIYNENGRVLMEIEGLTFTIPFPFGIFELVEVWRDKCYGHFEVSGKLVVDVGAFIGDTALYFAKQGAKAVYGFEPVTPIFRIAQENVKQNGYSEKIELRNCAVGCHDGKAAFRFNSSWLGASSIVKKTNIFASGTVYQIDTVSLQRIMEEIGQPIDFLKMDCEGAEHEIVPYAYKQGLLKNVKEMAIEVHGSPEHILSILKKANFKIDLSKMPIPNRYVLNASQC